MDANVYAQTYVEWIGFAFGVIVMIFLLLLSNVDALVMGLETFLALFDFICTMLIIILLFIYGQGYVFFGSIFTVNMFVFSYAGPTFDVAGALNSRNKAPAWAKWARIAGFMAILFCAVVLRVMVFLKQFNVVEGIVLLEIAGEEPITLRDLWEFIVDILVVRMFSTCVDRIRQPTGTISLGLANAKANGEGGDVAAPAQP